SRGGPSGRRVVLLPAHGAHVRGCDLMSVVICAEHLSKRYDVGRLQSYDTFRDALTRSIAAPFKWLRGGEPTSSNDQTIWALKNVTFDVRHGEIIGIIGRNGSGKSTLLKILSRITEPTAGRAQVRGRVGS